MMSNFFVHHLNVDMSIYYINLVLTIQISYLLVGNYLIITLKWGENNLVFTNKKLKQGVMAGHSYAYVCMISWDA